MAQDTYHLPHSHEKWPAVKEKLQRLAEKSDTGLTALAEAVKVSPHWSVDQHPMLNVLRKALQSHSNDYSEKGFCEETLPYIASRALEVETLFPEKTIKVRMHELLISHSFNTHLNIFSSC